MQVLAGAQLGGLDRTLEATGQRLRGMVVVASASRELIRHAVGAHYDPPLHLVEAVVRRHLSTIDVADWSSAAPPGWARGFGEADA
jgi:hypothetical protein